MAAVVRCNLGLWSLMSVDACSELGTDSVIDDGAEESVVWSVGMMSDSVTSNVGSSECDVTDGSDCDVVVCTCV